MYRVKAFSNYDCNDYTKCFDNISEAKNLIEEDMKTVIRDLKDIGYTDEDIQCSLCPHIAEVWVNGQDEYAIWEIEIIDMYYNS